MKNFKDQVAVGAGKSFVAELAQRGAHNERGKIMKAAGLIGIILFIAFIVS